MTEKTVQNALFRHLSPKSYSILMPNYTPRGWWECDLMGITEAGYMSEFEIKLSKSDFRKDVRKTKRIRDTADTDKYTLVDAAKHDQLVLGKGPCRFWYVAPQSVIPLDECPECAGLLWVVRDGDRFHFETAKEPPKLHKQKCDESIITHARSVCYYRYWNLRLQP